MKIVQVVRTNRQNPGSRKEGAHGSYYELEFGRIYKDDFEEEIEPDSGQIYVDFSRKRRCYTVDRIEVNFIKGEEQWEKNYLCT